MHGIRCPVHVVNAAFAGGAESAIFGSLLKPEGENLLIYVGFVA